MGRSDLQVVQDERALGNSVKSIVRERVKLPVQTGHGALRTLFRYYVGALGLWLVTRAIMLSSNPLLPIVAMACAGLLGLLVVVAWKRTMERRASDALFEQEGLTILGGPIHKMSFDWSLIDSEISSVDKDPERKVGHSLRLNGGESRAFTVARTTSPLELSSLQALLSTLKSWDRDGKARLEVPAAPGVELLTCQGCGAPLPLSDTDPVRCAHCQAVRPVPESLVTRVRAAAEALQSLAGAEVAIRRMLRQPSARFTNVLLVGLWLTLYGFVPATHLWTRGWYTFLSLALAVVLLSLLNQVLAGRRAIGVLVVDFAARAPAGPGGAYHCRQCGGPLAEPEGGNLLVPCVYCAAENILGLDYRGILPRTQQNAFGLEQILSQWRRARLVSGLLLPMLLLLVALGVQRVLGRSGSEDSTSSLLAQAITGEKALPSASTDSWPQHTAAPVPVCPEDWTPTVSSAVKKLERLTRTPLFEMDPTPIPGREELVFALRTERERDTLEQIYRAPAGDVAQARPFSSDGFSARHPEVTRDAVYFLRDSGRELVRQALPLDMSGNDGEPRVEVVARFEQPMGAFSVDRSGPRIAIQNTTGLLLQTELWFIDSNTGQRIATMPGGSPAYSPDGGAMVWLERRRDGWHLMVGSSTPYASDGLTRELLHQGLLYGPLRWSPRGRLVFFQAYRNDKADLFAIDPEVRRPIPLTNRARLFGGHGVGDDGGVYFAAAPRDCAPDLWRLELVQEGI